MAAVTSSGPIVVPTPYAACRRFSSRGRPDRPMAVLSPPSIIPAAAPSRIETTNTSHMPGASANPVAPSAAQAPDKASSTGTPNRRIRAPTKALTATEPAVMTRRISPRSAIGAPKLWRIDGQAVPSIPSGRPSTTKLPRLSTSRPRPVLIATTTPGATCLREGSSVEVRGQATRRSGKTKSTRAGPRQPWAQARYVPLSSTGAKGPTGAAEPAGKLMFPATGMHAPARNCRASEADPRRSRRAGAACGLRTRREPGQGGRAGDGDQHRGGGYLLPF